MDIQTNSDGCPVGVACPMDGFQTDCPFLWTKDCPHWHPIGTIDDLIDRREQMSYETFNEAMCKLKQVEEEFNKKLQEIFKPFIDEINRIDRESEILEEYCSGDEIKCINASCSNFNKKYIYLGVNGQRITLCRLEDGELQFVNNLKNYRKTGKHYKVII